MKVNVGKVLMAVVIILVALLLFALPDGAFGAGRDQQLVNPVTDHLDATGVSYIAKLEHNVLVIYLIKGEVDLDQLADLANLYDVRLEIRDLK